MVNYVVKRTGQALLTIFVVISFTFGLIRLLPGGPMVRLRAKFIRQGYSGDEIAGRIATYQNIHPDRPILEQYVSYVTAVLQGDLGTSVFVSQGKPVAAIIADALPWTVFIVTVSVIIFYAISITLGAMMAYREGTWFDTINSAVAIIFSGVPFYVLGIVLVYIFGYQLQWFPTGHRLAIDMEPHLSLAFVQSALYHATLPVLSMVLTQYGVRALAMRGNSIQVLGDDFVRVARLRGLSDRRIALWYVGRNAILPMYTGLLLAIGFLLGGTVILEQVFNYPGLGLRMVNALEARDYPLLMGVFLVITTTLVIGIYLADLTYGRLDPRIKTGDNNGSL